MTTDFKRWTDRSNLHHASWIARARLAAQYIPDYSKVLDLGCGAMYLRGFLPPHAVYVGSDLIDRDGATIVCDYNCGEFPPPEDRYDVITLLGVLEYIEDPKRFLRSLRRYGAHVLLTYTLADGMTVSYRESLGWINHFLFDDLMSVLMNEGFPPRTVHFFETGRILFSTIPQGLGGQTATTPLREPSRPPKGVSGPRYGGEKKASRTA
jgi:hypothetical protein